MKFYYITSRSVTYAQRGEKVLNQFGKNNVVSLNVGESTVVGDIEITAVFADHTVEAFGLIVKAENKTLYFSGDTLYNEKLFEILSKISISSSS